MDQLTLSAPEQARIPASLAAAAAELSAVLHTENNLGVELRRLTVRTRPETPLLVVFIDGLANGDHVRLRVLDPLERIALHRPEIGRLTLDLLFDVLPAPRVRRVSSLTAALEGICRGATALFLDGAAEAVLVATAHTDIENTNPDSGKTHAETFGPNLLSSLALIRKRLPDPALVAEPRRLTGARAEAALLYRHGHAESRLVEAVSRWLQNGDGPSRVSRGGFGGMHGLFGLLPDFMSVQWPEKAAALLDEGYVVVLVDGLPFAFMAPVTAAGLLRSPGDGNMRRPLRSVLPAVRVFLAAVVLAVPGGVVALMSYHPEMIPTPFLLAMARTRDNAPFPVLLEILILAGLKEAMREAHGRLPVVFGTGAALTAGILLVILLMQAGLVGQLPALATVVTAIASLGLPSYDLFYITRMWRLWFIVGAGAFGFYGLSAVAFLLLVYLTQAKSFGVPFIGANGPDFLPQNSSHGGKGGHPRVSA